jgi:hypothetical protein
LKIIFTYLSIHLSILFSLKTGKELINGKAKIRASFLQSLSHPCQCSRRVFVELDNGVSFAFDLHPVGTSPGLGDPKKETVLLYRCFNSVITNVWGSVDKQNLASSASLSLPTILSSELWSFVSNIIIKDDPSFTSEKIHFNDYTTIETWG